MTNLAFLILTQGAALLIGCALDLVFADPDFILHPIRIIGYEISFFERVTRKVFPKTAAGEKWAGLFMVIAVILINALIPFLILFFTYRLNIYLGIAIEGIICYFMLSARSLEKAGTGVYESLKKGDIMSARKRVSMIVGRDTENLDDKGIIKAAVETVAENTSDGVVAPLLYMVLGGGILGCVYKAINTMDSMVGYKNEAYINFGCCAAKLDDAANFIPSRLAAYLMILAAYVLPGYNGKNAAHIHSRDARNHPSPNSAQTESAAAGALGVKLAGDMYYFGKLYKKPTIGDGIKEADTGDIPKMNRLMYATSFLTALVFLGIKFFIGAVVM